MSVRFNNIDLYNRDEEVPFWKLEACALIPNTERRVWVSYPSCCGGSKKFFEAKMQNYEPPFNSNQQVRMLVSWSYRDWVETSIADGNSTFVADSLPSLDELIYCRETRHHFCDSGLFQGLHKAFSQFAEEYCNKDSNLPLQSLLRNTLRLRLLLGLYRMCPIIKYAKDSTETEFASWAMEAQLAEYIGKEAVQLEARVLFELERVSYGSGGIGKKNPLVTWVCLWLLILYYKSHLSFRWFDSGPRTDAPLYGLARHLYNAITSIYSALYKTTTPLIFDWRKEAVSEMLGRDPQLIRSFCNIKTEMFWLHAERDDLLEEDNLVKALVVDNDSRLLESHKKLARRQGIL